MKQKKPIDQKRDSGGTAEIGTKEDGAILEMFKIGERLIIIKEKSIYEFILADEIDPERKNIDLPNHIQKQIIDKGTESEIVARTFLTAKNLFKREFINDDIEVNQALNLTIDLLYEISELDKEVSDYKLKETEEREKYEANKGTSSYALPSIGNINTRCKTIFQKADHIEQTLMGIITVFYPNEGLTKQSHFPKFHKIIIEKYGAESPFAKFLEDITSFMKLVRAFRNALDHRLDSVTVYDFELQPNSDVYTPSIELNHKDSKFERNSLLELVDHLIPRFTNIIEVTIAYLSAHNSKPNLLSQEVKMIPVDQRINKNVKYAFWAPLGSGGYYNQ